MSLGRNLTHGMVDLIGREIVTGTYSDTPFPTEALIAEKHQVSRSVVREAVKMLTAKGLLTARPRKGTTVNPVTSWNLFDADVLRWSLDQGFSFELMRHFTELRLAVEPEAAALAASHANKHDVDLIRAALERMRQAESGKDNILEADIAFHVSILKASKNPFFLQMKDTIDAALRRSIAMTNQMKGRGGSVKDHGAVLKPIADREPEAAWQAMRKLVLEVIVAIDEQEGKSSAV